MSQITVSVGDRVRAKKEYKSDGHVHTLEGDVFLVIALKDAVSVSGGVYPVVDWCRCEKKGGGHTSGEFSWYMEPTLFENIGPLPTQEEVDRAKQLPTVDDVASFFEVNHGRQGIS